VHANHDNSRFAEQCCTAVVGAFVHVWHPDARDTFDNYFSTTSRFSDTREAMWTTSITISHFKLLPMNELVKPGDIFFEGPKNTGRVHGLFPPRKVALKGRVLKERSSSIVMTGDGQGYNWICTVLSSLTDPKAIMTTIDRFPRVLQLFLHQQASGRCLIFFMILGHICGKLTSEYNEILEHLDNVVELGVSHHLTIKGLD
jgi:hypothetical protein